MNKGVLAAKKLRKEIGLVSPDDIPIETVIAGRGGFLHHKPLKNADGRIIYGKKISTIYINSNIAYEGKRRFAMAHELGHLEMHNDGQSESHSDNNSLDWFLHKERQLKQGRQEYEANQFASEYLMPMDLFKEEAKRQAFTPTLLINLADIFKTSITSTAFRYLEANLHPIVLFHTFDGKIKYWKKSDDFKGYIREINRLSPPSDSVAREYIDANYSYIYKGEEDQQEINKSTWLELGEHEKDTLFYEYCVVSQKHKSILSIIWED